MSFRVALAQIDCILGDIEKNILKHIEIIEKEIENKSNIIVFPELSLTGYVLRDLNYDVALNPFKSELLKPFKELSKHITIIVGGVEEGTDYGLYNSAFLFEDNDCKFIHRKIYLPTYGLFEEQRYFSVSKKIESFNSKYGKLGILICEDFWHIPLPYILAKQGASIILGLSSSPTRIAPNEIKFEQYESNSRIHRVYAKLLSIYIAWCNRVGFEEGMNYWGGSEIIDPQGNVLCLGKEFEECIPNGIINFDEIKKARIFSKHFVDDDINFTINELRKIN